MKTLKLKNGIKIATYNLPHVRSVYIQIISKGGSIVEHKDNNGVAHFMEHMIVQGIPSFPTVTELSEYIESLSGSYNASTQPLQVDFYINLPSRYLEDGLKISSEVFFKPLFVKDSIEKERRAVIEELKQRIDSHYFRMAEFFKSQRFKPNHPLKLDSGGSLESVSKLNRDDLMDYWRKYFLPQNTYLVIIGNLNDRDLTDLLDKYFLDISHKGAFPGFPEMSNQDFTNRRVSLRHDTELKSCYIDLTFPSLALDASLKDRLYMSLLMTILGGLRNSRLYRLLRHDRGLVYSVGSNFTSMPGIGYSYISSEVSKENLGEVVKLVAQELSAFVSNGPTEKELEFAKNYLTNQWLMAFDHPSAIASWVESNLLWNERVYLPEGYIKLIRDVTPSQLIELMKDSWDFAKLNLSIQGAVSDSKQVKDRFTKLIEII